MQQRTYLVVVGQFPGPEMHIRRECDVFSMPCHKSPGQSHLGLWSRLPTCVPAAGPPPASRPCHLRKAPAGRLRPTKHPRRIFHTFTPGESQGAARSLLAPRCTAMAAKTWAQRSCSAACSNADMCSDGSQSAAFTIKSAAPHCIKMNA